MVRLSNSLWLETGRSSIPSSGLSLPPSVPLPWPVSMCRAQGLGNEWRPDAAPSLKPARNARPLFFLFSLLFKQPVSASSYLPRWNIPSAALIVHRRAGRHRLANQGPPTKQPGCRRGEKGTHSEVFPANIHLSWLLAVVFSQREKDDPNRNRQHLLMLKVVFFF